MSIISLERKLEIKQKVEPLLGRNLNEIVNSQGIHLMETDLTEIGNGVSGVIVYNREYGKFGIFIEQKDSPNRKRFTLAHELGHYFLHVDNLKGNKNSFIDYEDNYVFYRQKETELSETDKIIEAEANSFAAELLMPEMLVKRTYNESNRNIPVLAKFFRVSEQAMVFRLLNLGLISNSYD